MPMHTSLRDGAEKNIEYGEIAQLARAHGSYPWCRGFESPSRYDEDFEIFSKFFCVIGNFVSIFNFTERHCENGKR